MPHKFRIKKSRSTQPRDLSLFLLSETGGIVRSFLCDLDIVGVGLLKTGVGDTNELCTLLKLRDSRTAALAHTGADTADKLEYGVGN